MNPEQQMDLSSIPETEPLMNEGDHTEEFRQSLLGMVDKVKGKMDEFGANKKAMEMQLSGANKKLLGEFFDGMKSAGYDPNDQQSVTEYLDFLKENQPDMYAVIEEMLQQVLPPMQGQETMPPPVPPTPEGQPMGMPPPQGMPPLQ